MVNSTFPNCSLNFAELCNILSQWLTAPLISLLGDIGAMVSEAVKAALDKAKALKDSVATKSARPGGLHCHCCKSCCFKSHLAGHSKSWSLWHADSHTLFCRAGEKVEPKKHSGCCTSDTSLLLQWFSLMSKPTAYHVKHMLVHALC